MLVVAAMLVGGLWFDPFGAGFDLVADAAGVAWTQDKPGVDTAGAKSVANPGTKGSIVKSTSNNRQSTTPNIDPYALYAIDGVSYTPSNVGANVVIMNTSTAARTQQFGVYSNPQVEQLMLAVDSGLGKGQEGYYTWYRGPSQTAFVPDGFFPLWYYAPGASKPTQLYQVPDNKYFGFASLSWGSSGGAVDQRTGLVYTKTDMTQYMGPDMRLTAFDPKTMATYWSGQLKPASPSDQMWNSPMVPGYESPGYVTPGMAVTASGDIVLLVKGTAVAIAANSPINTTGRNIPAGSVDVSFLVKVHPSLDNRDWTYSVMKMITHDLTDRAIISMNNKHWGMAFSSGMLYLNSDKTLLKINPSTGLWNYLGETDSGTTTEANPSPQGGFFTSFSSAQSAASVTGTVRQKPAGSGYATTDAAASHIKLALYEQNPAVGYNQPTLIGTTVTGGSGDYTFIVPHTALDGSVKYYVRVVEPKLNNLPATIIAGAVASDTGLGVENEGQLVCGSKTYTGLGDGTIVSGPCKSATSPALGAIGSTADPATFGAYGLATMRNTWSDVLVDFTLLEQDLTAPEPPVITAPQDGTLTNNPSVTITGTGEPDAKVAVSNAGGQVCTAYVADNGTWSCQAKLAEGTHSLTATQTDDAGNNSQKSNTVGITIDATAPAKPVIVNPVDPTITNNPTVTISGTGETGSTVTVTASDKPVCTALVIDGKWTCDPYDFEDGVYILLATQQDSATNVSEKSDPVNLTVDTNKPAAPVILVPGDQSITNNPVVTISGTGESGAQVTVSSEGGEVCKATVADGKWSCTPVTFPDGVHELTAVQTDPASNTSEDSNKVTFTVDTKRPDAPVISTPADQTITNNPQVTISGTGESGAKVTVTDNGQTVCTAVVTAGKWACDPQEFDDGTYNFVATQTDPAGNTSGESNQVTITVDTAKPNPPTIETPADNSLTKNPEVTITGKGENGATVVVSDDAGEVCTAVVANGVWSCQARFEDGQHTLTAVQTDPANNTSEESNQVTFTVDSVAPNAPTIDAPTNDTVTNNPELTISGSGESGAKVTVTDNGKTVCTATVFGGIWSCAPQTFDDGTYNFVATQTDPAGNVSDQSNTVKVTIDTQAPAAPIILTPADNTVTNNPKVVVSGSGESGATVKVSDASGEVCTALVVDGAWSCGEVTFAEGGHLLTAVQTDPAANTSTKSPAVNLTIDSAKPDAPVIDTPVDGTFTNDPMVVIAGHGEAGDKVVVSEQGRTVCTTTVGSDGKWECLPALYVDGSYTVTATQTDSAGNVSEPSEAVTFTVDTEAPRPPVITEPADQTVTNNPEVIVKGTGESGSTVKVSDETGVVCTTTVDAAGKWECPNLTLEDGRYTFTATQTDKASNLSDKSNSVTITIDTKAPAAPVIMAPADGTLTKDHDVVIKGSGETSSKVVVSDKGGVVCTAMVVAGTWACDKVTLDDGIYVFTASQTDPAGNDSVQSNSVQLTIDSTPPAPPVITAPVDGTITNNPEVVISGTGEDGAEVTVSDAQGVICTATVTDGIWACDKVKLEDGRYILNAVQVDPATNQSEKSNTVTLTIATAKPAPPVITTPTDPTVTNVHMVTIAGTGQSGATVVVSDQSRTVCTAEVSVGAWSCDQVEFADGYYTLTAVQTDQATNTSEQSNTVRLTIDSTAPAAPVITSPTDGTITKDKDVTIKGSGEPGASVIVSDENGVVCTTTVVEDGTWACAPVSLDDGTYTFTAVQKDPAGNTSDESNTVTITIDTKAPAAPVIAEPGDGTITKNHDVTLKGTGEAGASLVVSDTNGVVCTTTVVADGGWTCPTLTLDDGSYTFTATQTDPAGNTSTKSNSVTITIDSIAPAAPVITAPTDGTVTKNPIVTISGVGETDATVVVSDANGTICTATVVAGKWSCQPVTLDDGTYTFTAVQTDTAGNESAESNSVTITIDSVAPDAPVITSPIDGTITNNPVVTIAGTGESGAKIQVSDGTGQVCTATVVDEKWACEPKSFADGTYTFTATQTDAAGNESVKSNQVTVTINQVAPTAPVITTPADNTVTSNPVVVISGTGATGATVVVSNANGQVCTATVIDGAWACQPQSFDDGKYTFTAVETDAAGNSSATSNAVTITIDTEDPAAPVILGPSDGTVTDNPEVTIYGSGETGATVTVSDANGPVCTAIVVKGAWSCEAKHFEDGTYTVTAVQTDSAGNGSLSSVPVTFTVDTKAPAKPVITAPADQTLTNNPVVVISGTGEAGASVMVKDEHGFVCQATVVADGTWVCDPVTMADGSYLFTAIQTDQVGNQSGKSDPVHLTIDSQAPTAPVITGPKTGTVTNDPDLTFTGTGEEGAEVTVVDQDGKTVCVGTVVSGQWTCGPVTLPEGEYDFSATQTDEAGNTSPKSDEVTVTIDTTAPDAPVILTPEDGTVTNNHVVLITGSGETGATVTVYDKGLTRANTQICQAVVRDGAWACDSVTLPDGKYTFQATQADAATNTSAVSNTVRLTINSAAPDAPVITGPKTGTTTNDPEVVITGEGQDGATVVVTDEDGKTVCETTVVDGKWTCPAVTVPEGEHTYEATQTDPAGNTSDPSGPITIVIDTTAPEAPVITGPKTGTTTKDPSVVITGTGEDDAKVVVSDETGQTVCTTTVVDGKWTCPAVTLPDGEHSFEAKQTDEAGNTSDPSGPITIIVDTTPPAPPVITGPGAGTTIKDPEVVITGDGENGATVTVTDEDGKTVCTTTVVDGHWTCPAVTVPEGEHTYEATQTDPAGNTSDPSDPITIIVDTTPPAPPVITGPGEGTTIKDPEVTITGEGEDGATVTVTDEDGKTVCTTTVVDGKWTCPAVTVPEGEHTYEATQTDPAGNTSDPSGPITIVIDTTAPEAPVITGPKTGTTTKDPSVVITGTGEDDAKVVVSDETGQTVCTTTVVDGKWTCPAVTLPDGEHSFEAKQTDEAGNTSDPSDPITIIVDTTPPAPPVITGPGAGTTTNDPEVVITGEGEDGATVTVTDEDGKTVCTTTVVDGKWTCPAVTVPEGEHTYEATQTDPAGNTSDKSDPITITVDTTPPAAPVITGPKTGTTTNDPEVTITGEGEDGATVVVTDEDGKTVCTTTVVDGHWTCPSVTVPEGEHTYESTQTDPAGNTSDPSGPITITVDTTPPAAPVITGPKTGTTTNDPEVTITGEGEDGATVVVTDEDGKTVCTTTVVDGHWTCPSVTVPEGEHTFESTQTDPAGNTSDKSDPITIIIDTTPPTPPVITGPKTGTTTNNPEVVITGNGEDGATVTVTDEDGKTVCTTTVVDGHWTCPSVTVPEGEHTFESTQTDPAGNTSDKSDPITIIIDTTPPVPPVITGPTDGTSTTNPEVTFTGTGESGALVTVTDQDNKTICTATVVDGKWTCDKVKLPDGKYDFTATQTDQAGNDSPESNKVTVTIDSTAPNPPVITGPKTGTTTNNPEVVISGEGEDGAKVTVTDEGGKTVCTTTVVDGHWTCPAITVPEGEHTYEASQTDEMGNTSKPSDKIDVTIDTTAPTAPVVDPSTGEEVTGKGEPGAVVTVTDPDGQPVPGCEATVVGEDGRFSCRPVTPLEPGTTVEVTQTDPAGNTSPPTTIVIYAVVAVVEHDQLHPGEDQVVTGKGFLPGEAVQVVWGDSVLANLVANDNGTVGPYTFTVPDKAELGTATITLVGTQSGPAKASFQVIAPQRVSTGGTASNPLTLLAASLLVLSGAGVALRRTHQLMN